MVTDSYSDHDDSWKQDPRSTALGSALLAGSAIGLFGWDITNPETLARVNNAGICIQQHLHSWDLLATHQCQQKKRVKHASAESASRFIDVEAAVGGPEDTDESSGNESFRGFVDDDADSPSMRTIVTTPVYRWRGLESDGAELMESLARTTREWYPRPPALETISETIIRQISDVTDPGIWQVRVKDGYNRDVVVAILWVTLAQITTTGRNICMAFSRDTITGSVYVEAFDVDNVRGAVRNVHGVLLKAMPSCRIHLPAFAVHPDVEGG